jgi:hypothetical protein
MNLKHYATITSLIFGTLVSSIVQAQLFESYVIPGINDSSPTSMNNSIYNMNTEVRQSSRIFLDFSFKNALKSTG